MRRRGFGVVAGAVLVLVGVAIPAQAAPPPVAGFGLSHRVCGAEPVGFARCHVDVVDQGKGAPNAITPTGLSPATIKSVYGLSTSATAGAGKTIAIVDAYDDPSAEQDLGVFSSTVRSAGLYDGERLFQEGQPDGWDPIPALEQWLGARDQPRCPVGARHRAGSEDSACRSDFQQLHESPRRRGLCPPTRAVRVEQLGWIGVLG